MKKLRYIAIAAFLSGILFSCNRNSTTISGGTWTFKNQTYYSKYTSFYNHCIVTNTVDNLPTGSLLLGYLLPTTSGFTALTSAQQDSVCPISGVYTATNFNNGGNTQDSTHIYIILTDSSATRTYTPSPYTTATVSVDRSTKYFKVTINNVMMVSNDHKDSALLNATLTQTP